PLDPGFRWSVLDDLVPSAGHFVRGVDMARRRSDSGSASEARRLTRDHLSGAIRIGAPAYDSADQRGCYEAYACAARLILRTIQGEEAAKGVLREALMQCATENDVSEQAWILRRAFDRIVQGD